MFTLKLLFGVGKVFIIHEGVVVMARRNIVEVSTTEMNTKYLLGTVILAHVTLKECGTLSLSYQQPLWANHPLPSTEKAYKDCKGGCGSNSSWKEKAKRTEFV